MSVYSGRENYEIINNLSLYKTILLAQFSIFRIMLMKTIEETRAERLHILCKKYGIEQLADLASLHVKTIEHWINTTEFDDLKSMTSQDARRIEAALNLERGWLDQAVKPEELIPLTAVQHINSELDYQLQQRYLETPEDKSSFIQFQLLDVKAILGKDFNEACRSDVRLVDISKKWAFHHLGYNIDHIALITVVGDAMSPSFADSDVLFIDTSINSYQNEGVYVFFGQSNILKIKRLQRLINGDIRVISDNHACYTPETVSKEYTKDIRICGKVVATWSLKSI